jgi:hypothetical protein
MPIEAQGGVHFINAAGERGASDDRSPLIWGCSQVNDATFRP